jgi:ADP-ribose pyrophosphatase YjhB (NUDIX family)
MKYNISARGILEKDNKILFIEYQDSIGKYYALPGGSQEKGESLSSTVIREFKEETLLDVEIKKLFMVREFILETSSIPTWENGIHQVEAIFLCGFVNEKQEHGIGSIPDGGMLGLKWIDKKDFKNYRLYPTQDLPEILEKGDVPYLFTNS